MVLGTKLFRNEGYHYGLLEMNDDWEMGKIAGKQNMLQVLSINSSSSSSKVVVILVLLMVVVVP